jgi:hypothetical protein
VVAALDPLRELDLLRGRQQVDPADVLEEELQCVGRHLARGRLDLGLRLVVGVAVDDLDLELFEDDVELVELRPVDVELVERQRDLLRGQRPVFVRGHQQASGLVRIQNVPHRPACRLAFGCVCVHSAPLR